MNAITRDTGISIEVLILIIGLLISLVSLFGWFVWMEIANHFLLKNIKRDVRRAWTIAAQKTFAEQLAIKNTHLKLKVPDCDKINQTIWSEKPATEKST